MESDKTDIPADAAAANPANPANPAASDTNIKKLSVVIPVYNERDTWKKLLDKVLAVELPVALEAVLVDDGSTDGTAEQLKSFAQQAPDNIKVILQPANRGKGAALRTGFAHITGDVAIVQDADLEYNPAEYPRLLQPILDDRADVVYGSRFAGDTHRVLAFWHSTGNRFLTLLSNMLTDLSLTDMETCYKMFRAEIIQSITIEQNRFGFEPEITAKIAKLGLRIYEMPISYNGRSYDEGKKIGWRDGLKAIWCIFKYALRSRQSVITQFPKAPPLHGGGHWRGG